MKFFACFHLNGLEKLILFFRLGACTSGLFVEHGLIVVFLVDPSTSVNNSTLMIQSNVSIEPDMSTEDPDTAYFIKPSGFRPNSLFVGRQAELAEMHKLLFDKKRRKEGTSAVLIQSLPGGGKTHLARQYLYDHKDDFPGGIFWIRAKSTTELAAGYWDIARKAALKHVDGEDAKLLKDPHQFIKMVRKWLNHRHDWLLVLDGIHFGDTEALEKFIPDSPNTSLIYTSTERSVAGNYHFKNPQIIRLPLLSAREAQRLLLLELDKKEPFSRDDLKHSTELVQAMGFLPVVIHAVSQRLKATDEPLSKFARSYVSEPRLRGLGTYMAVVDQLKALGAHEALNLIYLLCFFSQHIPVEMISLGLKALDVPVKTTEPISGRSLNNTFKILIMFALIDRNHHDDSIHSSQSSKSSRDMLADNVDVIRLHSVVQGFFFDTLSAAGTLPMWLDRAIRVFCCSYDMANDRITRKTCAGLVEDYRLYEIHGNRLKEHVVKNLNKHISREQREILEYAQEMIEPRLEAIKSEIERRTPESSNVIAGGRPDTFQTSIFDRTSSSSDTGPETPRDHNRSRVSTWGLDSEKDQHESPSSLTNEREYRRQMDSMYRNHFPLPQEEDPGYDSDREGSVAMTVQPSQRTVHQDAPLGPNGPWEDVRFRKSRQRPDSLMLHRTVKNMEKSRYRDSAGAYRAMAAIDPRVSHETAEGFLHRSPSTRAQSRGRMSGQSSAEVALTHINQSSPPPARGGGMISDRRSSSGQRSGRSRLRTGTASYASAVLGSTRDTIAGLKELVRPSTEPPGANQMTAPPERPSSSAMASLQRFPIEVIQPSPSPHPPNTPRIPYPTSPHLRPSADSEFYQMPGRYSQENLRLGPEPYPSNTYPRLDGMPPFETTASASSSPLASEYPTNQRYNASESLPASMLITRSNMSENPPFLSLSSPNIRVQRQSSNTTYIPGRPELSNQEGGYTSQPMSRDASGQSAPSTHSSQPTHPRRPSIAETEPAPQLPVFSPRIPPTSYQVYERMKQQERTGRDLAAQKEKKISPRLGYARAALIEKLEDWPSASNPSSQPSPPSQTQKDKERRFNPTAPSFSPYTNISTREASPQPPPAPANSMLSSASTSQFPSTYPSPQPQWGGKSQPQQPRNSPASFLSQPYSSPRSFNSFVAGSAGSFPSPQAPGNTPSFAVSDVEEDIDDGRERRMERFERRGSGGVKVGERVIEFGDFPEGVRVDEARERALLLRSWGEREREVERRKRMERDKERERWKEVGLGIGGFGRS